MQQINKNIYATWGKDIAISVSNTNHENETVISVRKSLIDIAKAKTGLKVVTLDVAWNINGKYFSETITG
jgi:hypothetical protein